MKTITTTLFMCLALISQAQSIKGKIISNDGKAIDYAAVTLHNATDSTFIKGEFTEEDGAFQFSNVENGQYFVQCNYLGYQNFNSKPFVITMSDVDLGAISLLNSAQELKGVTVTAKKPLIEMQADKMVLNTDASISSTGANGLELLRKAPGVTIDNNENISLKGKNGVRIHIDGKPSFLTPTELAALLKSLTAADIEAIEIITNPSAKYDAEGNAGIINLRLRKNKNYGTNGNLNLSAGYGRYHKTYLGLNLNNRNKKINTYGSIGIGNNKYYNDMQLYREQDGNVFDQDQSQVQFNRPLNGKFGVDYYKNDKHTFGLLVNANTQYMDHIWSSTSITEIASSGNPGKIDSILKAYNTITSSSLNANANLNYRYADTLGNVVSFDLDKGLYTSESYSMQPNTYYNAETGNVTTRRAFTNRTPSDIDIYTAKIDYDKAIPSKKLKLSLGAKYSSVKTKNTFLFYNFIDGQEIKNDLQSNRFNYDEEVLASYFNVAGTSGSQFSYQAGVRMERTHSIGDLIREAGIPSKPDDYRDTSYLNFFPSAAFTYNLNQNHAFNLTYSRRLDRPNYQDLNPFEWRLDELTFRKGNPFLRPQYNNNLELTYTLKQMTSFALAYSNSQDVVTDIVENDANEPNKSFINYRNLASQEQFSLTINSPLTIKSWWNGYVSASLYKAFYKARFPEYTFDIETPIASNLYMEHTFTLNKTSYFEVSGWFNSASIFQGSWISEPQGSLDIGLKKILFEGNSSLKLSYTDLLNTAPWAATSNAVPGLLIKGSGRWESRKVSINFAYKFGNSNVKSERSRKTGLEEEKKRIKS